MIVIIGGGITGLAAAYELAQRRVPFVLLEAAPRTGGLIRTERVDGFTIDAGADSMLAQKPAAVELCTELGLAPRLMPTRLPRTAFVLKGGHLHALPTPSVLGIPASVAALLRYDLLSPAARARLALEPLVPRRTPDDESVASFFRRRFGRATAPLIAEPLLGGIHAGDIERLSMRSVFPRFVEAERDAGVLRTIRTARRAAPDGMFRALPSGMGELVASITERLPPGSVRTGAAATSLQGQAGSWRVAAGGQVFTAGAVVIAAPAYTAAALLAPVDASASELCASVPYTSTASVALGWRRGDIAHELDGSGFVVARRYNAVRITACTWVSSKWERRAPAGFALLRAFLGGAHDPHVVDLPDEELVEVAVRDLTRVLRVSAPPVLSQVYRWRNAGAQHHVGHGARMERLRERLRALPGLFLAGSGFDSIGIPDCIAGGRRVGAAAAAHVERGE